jgi:hypothetical protein
MHATDLSIASPCGADWRAMKPSDKKRFCDTCRKHVHDLSAMPEDEARAVLASPPLEGLCVRFLYDAHGDVVFRPREIVAPSLLVRAKRLATYAVAAAFPVALTACMGAAAPAPPVMMGAVACPMPPTPSENPPDVSASALATKTVPVGTAAAAQNPAAPPRSRTSPRSAP